MKRRGVFLRQESRVLLGLAATIVISALPVFLCVGQETRRLPNGAAYAGEMKDGKPNGQGTETWPDGCKYIGQFQDGHENGQGTYTCPDGAKYVGEFKDGKRSGQGTYTFSDGR